MESQAITNSRDLSSEHRPSSCPKFITAILIWPLAFLYARMIIGDQDYWNYFFGVFVVGFILLGEAMYHTTKQSKESIAMLVMLLIVSGAAVFGTGQVFDAGVTAELAHLYAVYWILCRSGKLLRKETSDLFLLDGIRGFFVYPFGNFLLVFKTLFAPLSGKKEASKRMASSAEGKGAIKQKFNSERLFPVIMAVFIGLVLFRYAMKSLTMADANFEMLIYEAIPDLSGFAISEIFILELIFMVPVACYLYGLLGGCFCFTEEQRLKKESDVDNYLAGLRKVPDTIWFAFILLFSAFYIFFFFLQGSYMFSAFRLTLPESYTYSEYARSGFSNMIEVVVINFMLLWLTLKTSEGSKAAAAGPDNSTADGQSTSAIAGQSTSTAAGVSTSTAAGLVNSSAGGQVTFNIGNNRQKTAAILLTVESMIFTLIAALKLFMYINAYGFTPLRLQSAWLCVVVTTACICIIVHIVTGKNPVRFWFYFSAGTLALLTVL